MTAGKRAVSVLMVSTLAFTVCFAIWMMFGIGIPIKQTLGLNSTQFGVLIATPVLSGSLIRVPLGMWTDKFGGRIVLFVLMLAARTPLAQHTPAKGAACPASASGHAALPVVRRTIRSRRAGRVFVRNRTWCQS